MKKFVLLILLIPILIFPQDNLLNEIDNDDNDNIYSEAAFKGLKIVNFESTKLVGKKQLYFVVSHRFGSVKTGISDFFGLDNANTRLHFIYGFSDGFNLGLSRSSFNKTYDLSAKYRLLRQEKEGFPVTKVG